MIIHLYATTWNDTHMLKYFFRHYDRWVDQYFLYDDDSTDGTIEYLERHPKVNWQRHERKVANSWVESAQYLYNECWKKSKGTADWVLVVNVDEHLYHPNMKLYLKACKTSGVTLIPSLGYQMLSEKYPTGSDPLYKRFNQGAPWLPMCKMQLFDPNAIEEINFTVGRHMSHPDGAIAIPAKDEVLNLHYKYLGLAFLKRRQAELATGLREKDIEQKWGFQYHFNEAEMIEDFNKFKARKVDLFTKEHQPEKDFPLEKWWKKMRQKEVVLRQNKWLQLKHSFNAYLPMIGKNY